MSPATPPPQQPGILLVRGGVSSTVAWAESGVAAVAVVPQDGGWTAVLPVAETTGVAKPYDDAVTMLLGRPVPQRLRPALGLGVVDRRAVVCVAPGGWRAVRRWLVWQPMRGVVHPGGLPLARLADIVAVAGAEDPAALGSLADVLYDPAGDARHVVSDVLDVLGLPGGSYLDGSQLPAEAFGASVISPSSKVVQRFQSAVHDDVRWRDEMKGQQR